MAGEGGSGGGRGWVGRGRWVLYTPYSVFLENFIVASLRGRNRPPPQLCSGGGGGSAAPTSSSPLHYYNRYRFNIASLSLQHPFDTTPLSHRYPSGITPIPLQHHTDITSIQASKRGKPCDLPLFCFRATRIAAGQSTPATSSACGRRTLRTVPAPVAAGER